MKKILAVLLLTLSTQVFAWHNGYGYNRNVYVYNNGYNNNWVAPALAGAVVGAALARPYYTPPPTYYPPTVVYTQPPVTYIQQPYPAGYHQESILDANCNCYRTVWVQN